MPQPLVPPYSVVKILDQKDTTTYLPSQFANQYGPNGTGTTYLGYIKWYEVVAINPDGTPRTDGQHRIIQGWATASFFVRVSNPFAAAREKKQQDGEKACPPGKQMQVATNLEADPKTGHFAPQLGWKRRIDIIGPTEWPGYINHLCLVRVTDTGAVLMMDATSVMPLN
jgi:hypothetical protein